MLLVLSLSLLGLGAAQQCEGFVGVLGMTPDHLKKEIRANVAVASYPGCMGGENSLVSTVCTCAIIPRKTWEFIYAWKLSVKSIRIHPIYFRIIERCSRLQVEYFQLHEK